MLYLVLIILACLIIGIARSLQPKVDKAVPHIELPPVPENHQIFIEEVKEDEHTEPLV